ncbi:LANO_0G17183g1_1 [Lachancea nothofagi CBS 11611]|uniref:LANO_0G17183g1_1 n=1 Tax=Lachancea nothofagi CBS 11611 TaxID=1266666 RepID=A0A1G4KKV2_9SACH|nr:LANO_0G17183g1_1 [Lachancea nothofagi CBS 11611]
MFKLCHTNCTCQDYLPDHIWKTNSL